MHERTMKTMGRWSGKASRERGAKQRGWERGAATIKSHKVLHLRRANV